MWKLDFVIRVFKYLDELRESGETNMFGAGPYVEDEFGLEEEESKELTIGWMRTFDGSADVEERAKEFIKSKEENQEEEN